MRRDANYWVNRLGLDRHPEGGYFKEIYRAEDEIRHPISHNIRSLATSIYYLLEGKDISHFHILKSDELWYFHDGTGAIVHILKNGNYQQERLGLDIDNGQMPQLLIPANSFFAAEPIDKDSFVLMGCMVTPGFDFDDFELADQAQLIKAYPEQTDLIDQFSFKK